jgi:hypothetical protein
VQLQLNEQTLIQLALAILTEVVRLNIHPSTATASEGLAGTGQSIQQQLLGTGSALREVKLHIITSFCNRDIVVTI